MLSTIEQICNNISEATFISRKQKESYNDFELKVYEMLDKKSIEVIKQYKVRKYYYDAYLPEFNLLLELDGDYFHPIKESDCNYPMQVKNFKNDIKKNNLAKTFGYNILRIRESELPKIFDIKEFIIIKLKEQHESN